jgi:hypothetical protein
MGTMTPQPAPAIRDRVIGAAVALALAIGLAWLPVLANNEIGGVPLNAVWIAVTTAVAFWLAPQVRDATPRRLLGTAIQMTLVVVVVSALASGVWLGLSAVLEHGSPAISPVDLIIVPLGFALVGLLLFGLIGVAFGIPAAGVWAATVRFILARDLCRR